MAVSASDKLFLPSTVPASRCGETPSKRTVVAFLLTKARFCNGCFPRVPRSTFLCDRLGEVPMVRRNPIVAESTAGEVLEKPSSTSPSHPSLCERGAHCLGSGRGAAMGGNMAEVLQRITVLHNEVSEASKRASEYLRGADEVQAQGVEEPGGGGGSAADYNRRAYLYNRSAEIVQESKKKGEEVFAELQALQVAAMQDNGRTPADYKRRAEVFTKTAEVFGRKHEEDMF